MNADEVAKPLKETDIDDHDYYFDLCLMNCQQIICCVIWHGSILCLQCNSVIFSPRILIAAESGVPSTTRVLIVTSHVKKSLLNQN